MGRNVEWTERYLATLPPELAESPLAATALTLADGLDRNTTSYHATSMMANSHKDILRELRELAPEEKASDQIDELSSRRGRRRRNRDAAAQ